LAGHADFVLAVAVRRGRLYTASKDKTSKVASLGLPTTAHIFHQTCSHKTIWRRQVWDYNTGTCVRTVTGHQGWVTGIAIDDYHLYTSSWDKTVRQVDLETGALVREFVGHSLWVTALALRGAHLFTSSADCTVFQWNVATGARLACLEGHTDAIWSVVADGGAFIYTCSQDKTARQWDMRTGKESHLFAGHSACVWCLGLTELYLLTGSEDKTAKQWSLSTGLVVREFSATTEIRSLAVNEGSLFTGLVDGQVMQWDIETGRRQRCFQDHHLEVTSISVADGFLFTGSDDCSARQHWVTWSGGSIPGHPAAEERFFAEKMLSLYNELGSVAASVDDVNARGGGVSRHIHGEEERTRLQLELDHMKSLLGTQVKEEKKAASPPPPIPLPIVTPSPPKPSSLERLARLEKVVSQSRGGSWPALGPATPFATSPWPSMAVNEGTVPEETPPTLVHAAPEVPEVPTPSPKAMSPAERLRARSKMNLQGKIGLPPPGRLPGR